jgi:hypothetical protein
MTNLAIKLSWLENRAALKCLEELNNESIKEVAIAWREHSKY